METTGRAFLFKFSSSDRKDTAVQVPTCTLDNNRSGTIVLVTGSLHQSVLFPDEFGVWLVLPAHCSGGAPTAVVSTFPILHTLPSWFKYFPGILAETPNMIKRKIQAFTHKPALLLTSYKTCRLYYLFSP